MNFRERGSRRGSALLIVLGMFSFMLVSAVAFSVYMRASRAPSSYVRRNASARHLVKAALARAMDEIDCAIGNDPFPGVGYNHDYGGNGINQGDRAKNDNWHGRVFTPSNEVAYADTVSTLTLEALGYLPACLVNETRYWSRHSRTATWHSFNYGLGQFAFTAVNVSDFFDLAAFGEDGSGQRPPYLNRNSAPHGRISPTYLFRSSEKGDMDTGGSLASAFLSALASGSGLNADPPVSEVPFVSLMDFNLALGNNAVGGIASPFMKRLQGSSGGFLSSVGEDVARRQVFMAGGWSGDSNLTFSAYQSSGRINLRYPEFQPFAGYSWFPEATTLSHCYNDVAVSHPFWQPVNNNFPVLATALLCDYLDFDNVPLSLCIPCAEAVPMICGVELNDGCVKYSAVMQETELQAANPEQGIKRKIKRSYSLHVEVKDVETTLTAVYPFPNGPQGQSASYDADAFVRVFFTVESGDVWDKGLRTSCGDFSLGRSFNWSVGNQDGVAFLQMQVGSASVKADAVSGSGESAEKSAIQKDIAIRSSGSVVKDALLADLVYEVDSTGNETLVPADCANYANINFYDGGWNAVEFLGEIRDDAHPGVKFRPSAAVYARIRSGGKTVDMVPAIADYDSLNGFSANSGLNGFNRASGGSAGTPLLRFFDKVDGGTGIELTKDFFKNNSGATRDAAWAQKAYIANDPRINWAPEQWWATDNSGNPAELWFNAVKTFRQNNSAQCDPDIFMAVSDQGYLQSMYEWLMVPQVRSITTTDNPEWGAFEGGGGYDGVVRTAAENVLHRNLMWRTYRSDAFGVDSGWGSVDAIPFDEPSNGIRVNPYTDVTNIMFGAFANMPRDWWAASTNKNANGKNYMDAASGSFKDDYLFDWSCEYKGVYSMASYWMGAFREKDRTTLHRADDWYKVFEDSVDWYDGDLLYRPEGVDVATVESILKDEMFFVDRKYLYGYLKGCFANTSQLFLLFVRAESAAGGGGAGSGARAVALVWRDPTAPAENGAVPAGTGQDNAGKYLNVYGASGQSEETWRLNARRHPPHKMRVLFYHQLD